MNRRVQNSNQRHGAAALTVVIVCIGVIGALMFASLQTSLRQRRQLGRELQMEQTRWLAEAGIEHAKQLIQSGDEPESGSITVKPKLDGVETGQVEIEFRESAGGLEVNATAWIGLADRPETQTRQQRRETITEAIEE